LKDKNYELNLSIPSEIKNINEQMNAIESDFDLVKEDSQKGCNSAKKCKIILRRNNFRIKLNIK